MLNIGAGERHVNGFLAAVNLPTISHRALKQREEEVGGVTRKLASRSCEEALKEEKKRFVNRTLESVKPPSYLESIYQEVLP